MSSNQYTVNIVNADELYIGGRKIQALELGVLVSDDEDYGIGIGTDKPRLKLDISGADGIRIPVGTTGERPNNGTISNSGATNLLGVLRYNTITEKYEAVYDHATIDVNPSWGNFVIETGTNVGDNKVGINTGTATPRQTLDVNGKIGINDYIIHNGDTDTTIGFPTNDTLTINTNGTERMRVDHTGNVGIGTDDPDYKLHVYEKENITKTMISFNKKAFSTSSNYIENTLVNVPNDSFTWDTVPRYGFKLGSWKNGVSPNERSGFTLETINNSSSDWKNRLKINQNGFFYFNSPDTETETFYSPYHFSFKPRTTNKYSKINANSTSKINDLTFSNLSLLQSVSQNVFGKHSVFIGKGCSLYNVADKPSTPEFIAFSEQGSSGSQNFYGGGIMLNDKIHFITYNTTQSASASSGLTDSDGNTITDGAKFPLSTYTRMTIDENGNVGIGTTTPNHKLEVNGGTENGGQVVKFSTTDNTWIETECRRGYSDTQRWGIGNYATGKLNFYKRSGNVGTAGIKMTIDSNGRVGIGEDSPDMKLHIKTDGGDGIKIESTNSSGAGYMYIQRNTDGKCYVLNADNQALILGANNNTSQLYLKENGNVGIGETNPGYKLHVNGTMRVTGTMTVDSTIAGNVSGSSGSCTGNAGTVTNGVYYNTTQTITGTKTFTSDVNISSTKNLKIGTLTMNSNQIWNSSGTLYLQHAIAKDVSICYNGGNVGIGRGADTESKLHIKNNFTTTPIALKIESHGQNDSKAKIELKSIGSGGGYVSGYISQGRGGSVGGHEYYIGMGGGETVTV